MHVAAEARALPRPMPQDRRTLQILARSIYKDMKDYGIPEEKILEVASELIGLVTEDLSAHD